MARRNYDGQLPDAASEITLATSVLPANYRPRVAGFARGPFLVPALVTPTQVTWRNARTYIVQIADGRNFRAVRITAGRTFVGWWAVEEFGLPLYGEANDAL